MCLYVCTSLVMSRNRVEQRPAVFKGPSRAVSSSQPLECDAPNFKDLRGTVVDVSSDCTRKYKEHVRDVDSHASINTPPNT